MRIARKANVEGIASPESARAYDLISRWPQFRFLRRLVVSELKKHHPDGTVVDVGCGPGYLIAVIAKSLPNLRQIIGVDVAEEMLEVAANNLAAAGLRERVKFQHGDVSALPFKANAVDFVVSTLSLHHWVAPQSALLEIHRVLKPGGQFLIFDLRRDSRRFFYWLLHFVTRFVVYPALRSINEPLGSVLASYTPDEVAALVSKAGFQRWHIKPGFGWMFIWGCKD